MFGKCNDNVDFEEAEIADDDYPDKMKNNIDIIYPVEFCGWPGTPVQYPTRGFGRSYTYVSYVVKMYHYWLRDCNEMRQGIVKNCDVWRILSKILANGNIYGDKYSYE